MAKDVGPYRWVAVGEMVHFVGEGGLGVGAAIGLAATAKNADFIVADHNNTLTYVSGAHGWGSSGRYVLSTDGRWIGEAKDEIDAREIAECHNRCLSELRGDHVPAGQVDFDDPKAVLCRFMRALGLQVTFEANGSGIRWVAAVDRKDVTVSERDAKALIEVARGLA